MWLSLQQQATSREADSTTSPPSEDGNQSATAAAAAVTSDTAAVSGASADSTSEGANVDSSTAEATEVTAPQPAQEQQPKAQPYFNADSSDSQENSGKCLEKSLVLRLWLVQVDVNKFFSYIVIEPWNLLL